eukprot:TRINITY_DN6684_c0_g1_i4.p1 TRINITY_DN6684_c0_g1~~TRINITY_DN6684_c0_g1_i4.p1  ORF type:complete len:1574 (+),score=500.65 TRINITY_DN6684_c0_g1_i4:183-4904(+)
MRHKQIVPKRLNERERNELYWDSTQVSLTVRDVDGRLISIDLGRAPSSDHSLNELNTMELEPDETNSRGKKSKRQREFEEAMSEALFGMYQRHNNRNELPRSALRDGDDIPERERNVIIVDDDAEDVIDLTEDGQEVADSVIRRTKKRKTFKPFHFQFKDAKESNPIVFAGTVRLGPLEIADNLKSRELSNEILSVSLDWDPQQDKQIKFLLRSKDQTTIPFTMEFEKEMIDSLMQLSRKELIWACGLVSQDFNESVVEIWFTPVAFVDKPEESDVRGSGKHVKYLVQYLHPRMREIFAGNEEDKNREHFDPQELYDFIQPDRRNNHLEQHPFILPSLRKYQLQASYWMVKRERGENLDTGRHPFWIDFPIFESKSGIPQKQNAHYNPYGGCFTFEEFKRPNDIRGGILADEMGLGKTLEVLMCLLSNPNKKTNNEVAHDFKAIENSVEEKCKCTNLNEESIGSEMVQCDSCGTWQHTNCIGYVKTEFLGSKHYCDQCLEDSWKLFQGENNATLIITPNSILTQWKSEIEKHLVKDSLRVLVYQGVSKQLILPKHLSTYDIVLTSYDVLKTELNHSEDNRERSFRNKKKYRSAGSPLVQMKWYRVVLDECQMVESTSAKAAEMAHKVPAHIRWGISGTPFQKGLEDLYGLLFFLEVRPFSERFWWNSVIQVPLLNGSERSKELLYSLCKKIMWRNSKKNVEDELELPPQTEKCIFLRFSPVEKYFYGKLKEECKSELDRLTKKMSNTFMRKREYEKAIKPLLKLRQACCHFKVGSSSVGSLQKNLLTIDQLLDSLIQKAKIETEEQQRKVVSSLNGVAGIQLIKGNVDFALKNYVNVIYLDKQALPRIDLLQKLHAYFNLYEVMMKGELESTELPDGQILTKEEVLQGATECKEKYIKAATTKQDIHKVQSADLSEEMKKYMKENGLEIAKDFKIEKKDGLFFQKALVLIREDPISLILLMDKLKSGLEELSIGKKNPSKILGGFRQIEGLSIVLSRELQKLFQARFEAIQAVQNLLKTPTEREILLFANCSVCRKREGPECNHCKVEGVVRNFEKCLFRSHKKRKQNDAEADDIYTEEITRVDAELETSFKIISSVFAEIVRKRGSSLASEDFLQTAKEEGQKQIVDLFELLKKEFKAYKTLWRAEKWVVSSYDEVEMAKTRIQMRQPGEAITDEEKMFKFLPVELDQHMHQLESDKKMAEVDLKKALSQVGYLDNLAKQRGKGMSDEQCPICFDKIGPKCCLLPCGHPFCEECISAIMRKKAKRQTLKCPMCRFRANIDEVSYIMDEMAEVKEMINNEPLKGSFGTKIEGVVRHILSLRRKDALIKILVFSEWNEVLEIIASALKENEISFIQIKGKNKFDSKLKEFKEKNTNVLLLPIKTCANGLNLIEATCVISVEPSMNQGREAQAFNRVHRIGQTRPTEVYRFIVRGTIEEKILSTFQKEVSVKQDHSDWKKDKMMSVEAMKSLVSEEEASTEFSEDMNNSQLMDFENSKYWEGQVKYHRKVISREEVLQNMIRVDAFESKLKKDRGETTSNVFEKEWMGKSIPQHLLDELMVLEEVSVNEGKLEEE